MIIAEEYSFNHGKELIEEEFPEILAEVKEVIGLVDARTCILKAPQREEIKRAIKVGVTRFYSPIHLNVLFDYYFLQRGWDIKPRIKTHDQTRNGYREIDFIKSTIGVEVQFGKYSFLTYDIIGKMKIFQNFNLIKYGIEICMMASMLPFMSTGIGAFEQVRWDLERRGADTNFDVPVLVLGVEVSANQLKVAQQLSSIAESREPEVRTGRYKRLTEKARQKILETGLSPELKYFEEPKKKKKK